MLKKYFKQTFIMIFFIFSVVLTAEDNFMAVGNIKIVTIQQSILSKSPSIVGSELLQTKVRLYFKEST